MGSMLAVIAATWALAMALGPLLQIRKIVEHESSHTISLGYFFCCSSASLSGSHTGSPRRTSR